MADSLSAVSGVSSGVDWKALVDAIIAQDHVTATRIQSRVDAQKKEQDALGQLKTLLGALGDAAKTLKDGTGLDTFSGTVVNGTATNGRTLFTAVPGAGASPGQYDIEVQQLAQAQKRVGTAALAPTGALGLPAGSFTINGQTVTVSATDTLVQVRDQINALNASKKTGVTASILSAGTSDARLVLSADKAGASTGFTLVDGGQGVVAALGVGGADLVQAKDATIVVDGVTITRSSNVISDAIPGVTITASQAEVGKVATLKVDRYTDGARGNVQAFVDAYNKVVDWNKTQMAVTGALHTESLPRSLRSTLGTTLLGKTLGAPADMETLSMAGVTVDKTGKLSVDSAKFDKAFQSRDTDLRALFSDRFGAMKQLADSYAQTGAAIDGKNDLLTTSITQMQKRIDDLTAREDRKRTALLAQYAKSEATLGRLKSIGDAIGAQITGMNKSNNNN